MSYFDQLYSSVYLLIKLNKPKSARRFARNYVLVLKTGLILCILLFFMNFSQQMHLEFLSHKNAQIIFLLIFIVNIFNNWMYYNGKRHSIIISKSINRLRTKSLIYLVFIQLLVYMLVIILSNAGI
jgi:hypothetical protein